MTQAKINKIFEKPLYKSCFKLFTTFDDEIFDEYSTAVQYLIENGYKINDNIEIWYYYK